jgi:hypothetical protein
MLEDNSEKRSAVRLDYREPIILETLEVGAIHKARMLNFSKTGIYFESNFYLIPGAEIYVGISNSPYASAPGVYECYRSTIQWRKFLEDSAFDYGYGVELTGQVSRDKRGDAKAESRSHSRKSCSIPTLIQSTQRKVRGLIKNASCGGVFIRCSEMLSIGQRVFLTIPLRKKRKIVTRAGEIVWADQNGVGIKFDEESPATSLPSA